MNQAGMYRARVARRQRTVRLRGVDHAIHEWGEAGAPLLVYLHGWADCAPTFQFVVDALAGRWHVLAPDLRGFGDSRADVTSYWFPDYLADLDRLLDSVRPTEPVCLAGHSMGGNIAGLYAGAVPERIAAFVNLEGLGLPDSDPVSAPAHYRRWLHAARTLDGFATYPDFDAFARHLSKRHPRLSADRALFVARCWGREAGGEVRLKADPLHKLPNPVLYRRAEAVACWRNISAPTLLLTGADSDIARRVAGEAGSVDAAFPVPGVRTESIAGSGHMLHFDAPAVVAGRMEAFLATVL